MSVQLLDDIAIESDETPLNDMANLKLGSACSSCENHKNNLCRCTSLTCGGGRGAKDGRKCTLFPYFWRKTQLNPFVKSTRKTKRNFEVLQPSKLSYISASRGGGGGVAVLSNSSFSIPSSSSTLSSTSSSSWSSVHVNSSNTNNANARLIASLPSTKQSQSVIITSPSNVTIAGDQIISSDSSTIPKSTEELNNLSSSASTTTTSQCPVVIVENSLLPSTSSSIATTAFTGSFQPSLSLPDFTSLSIKGLSADNNSENGLNRGHNRPSIIVDERGENETTRLLLGKRTVTQRQMMTELNGAMLNFRLDSRSSGSSRSSRSSIKIPKWKSRIRCSYRTKALPPILEDESDQLSSSSSANVNSSPSASNSPNLNCSQQALMESMQSSSVDPVDDITIDELAGYLDVFVYIGSKQMSSMAEMMYT